MKVDNVEKFWMVMRFQPRTNPQDKVAAPRFRHKTLAEAEVEALRLAKKYPNANFVILESSHFIKSSVIPKHSIEVTKEINKPAIWRRMLSRDINDSSLGEEIFISHREHFAKIVDIFDHTLEVKFYPPYKTEYGMEVNKIHYNWINIKE